MAGSENVAIVGTVAQAVCYGPNLGSPITEDVEILSELVQRTEPGILMTTFSGLARLGRDTRFEEVALSLATQIRLNDDPKLAEEYCEMFATKGLSVNALHRDQVQNILEKLVPVQELNEQGVGAFLSRISGSHPDLLVEFLVKRLERYRELSAGDESTEYETFPLRGIHFNDLRTTPNYESALKRLRDFVLEYPDDWLWAIPLFWAAGTIDDTTLLVLDEWVHSGEEAKLTGVLALLSEAPRGLVVSRPFFAVHLAEEYGRVGLEWERKMIGQLATNSLSIGFGYVGASIPSPFGQAHEKAAELVKCFPVDSPAYRLFAELVANKENWNPPSPVMDGVEIEE
jgi:hypothetical protein